MPRAYLIIIIGLLITLALLPFALIARARATKSRETRPVVIWHMDKQNRYSPQGPNSLFEDGRAMRLPVPGTVAREDLNEDDHYYRGKVDGQFATTFPSQVTINEAFMHRGQQRYNIYCAPCHGYSGYGDGMVATRADKLQQGVWVPPTSYHDSTIRERPVGDIFNTISRGKSTMPAYGAQIPVADRWAIVAYVRALQKSQYATAGDAQSQERQTP